MWKPDIRGKTKQNKQENNKKKAWLFIQKELRDQLSSDKCQTKNWRPQEYKAIMIQQKRDCLEPVLCHCDFSPFQTHFYSAALETVKELT